MASAAQKTERKPRLNVQWPRCHKFTNRGGCSQALPKSPGQTTKKNYKLVNKRISQTIRGNSGNL